MLTFAQRKKAAEDRAEAEALRKTGYVNFLRKKDRNFLIKLTPFFESLWDALETAQTNSDVYPDVPSFKTPEENITSISKKCPNSIPEIIAVLEFCNQKYEEDDDFSLLQPYFDFLLDHPTQALNIVKCAFFIFKYSDDDKIQEYLAFLLNHIPLAEKLEKQFSELLKLNDDENIKNGIGKSIKCEKRIESFRNKDFKRKFSLTSQSTISDASCDEHKDLPRLRFGGSASSHQ